MQKNPKIIEKSRPGTVGNKGIFFSIPHCLVWLGVALVWLIDLAKKKAI